MACDADSIIDNGSSLNKDKLAAFIPDKATVPGNAVNIHKRGSNTLHIHSVGFYRAADVQYSGIVESR